MTSRSYDGVGYYAPSFASDTPIYDSLVAERGVPQIAPINVPAALPPAGYDSFGSSSYGNSYGGGYGSSSYASGSNLPAMQTPRLALGPGPSSPSYGQPSPVPASQPYIPHQPNYGGAPSHYAAPVAPVAPLRPAPPQPQGGYGYPQQQYPQQRGY